MLRLAILAASLAAIAADGIEYDWVYANPRFVPPNPLQNRLAYAAPDQNPPDYVHMGMLEVLPDGTLTAVWQGATVFWEGSQNQSVYIAQSPDGGHTWQSPQVLLASTGRPLWAPVLHVQDNTTWLFYSESRPQCIYEGEGGRHWGFGGDIRMLTSPDSGQTWSNSEMILSFSKEGGIGKMIANKPTLGPDGELLLPFWREMSGLHCNHAPTMHGKAGVLRSVDQGMTWEIANVQLDPSSPPTWLIEGTLSELPGKQGFLQLFRTQAQTIYAAQSQNGIDWSNAESIDLPNPNSKVDSLALPDGRLVLAFNDDPKLRTKLTLATSADGGKTWQRRIVLESDSEGAFAYPTLQYLPDQDKILVIYTVAYRPRSAAAIHRVEEGLQRAQAFEQQALQQFGIISLEAVTPQESINAWGWDFHGLRVAHVDVALLDDGGQS